VVESTAVGTVELFPVFGVAVLVSAVTVALCGPETYIFGSDENVVVAIEWRIETVDRLRCIGIRRLVYGADTCRGLHSRLPSVSSCVMQSSHTK